MTQEEKAKRYDEALKVLHKYDGANIMFSQSLKEEMFPELKESEDERIRKEIIIYLKSILSNKKYGDKFIESWIDWLEKQGKNNMGISEATKQELEDSLHKALEKETPESCNEFLEKQGEQKPADKVEPDILIEESYQQQADDIINMVTEKPAWSEEDERIYSSIMYSFAHNYPLTIQQQEFVKSLKDRVQPQLQQGWTEEDERIIKRIKSLLYAINENDFEDIYAWLKSLKDRVQPNREWSKEDEVKINRIVACLENLNVADNDILLKDVDWLKSLRSQNTWKPSDEQMEALWSATEKYLESDNENVRTLRGEVLESLYKDLKKLREE